jgi:uncharacterized Zn-finger protein
MELFACEAVGCFKVYKSRTNLKRHIEAIHADTKRYQCSQCSKVLSSKQNLTEHKFIHTQELPYICRELGCGQRFRHGSQYSAHKRIHNVIKNIVESQKLQHTIKVTHKQLPATIGEEEKVEVKQGDKVIALPRLGRTQQYFLPRI